MKPKIRQNDDPILTTICDLVNSKEELQNTNILKIMKRVMRSYPSAVGLAAPQVGFTKRIIMIKYRGFWATMINPSYNIGDCQKNTKEESCLSFPDLSVLITRYNMIEVTWRDEKFNLKNTILQGMTARIIQHEIDHLNGITINYYRR